MPYTGITLEDYSEKAVAIFGDTKPHKDNLSKLGGKFNSNLRGRSGWIFSKAKSADVLKQYIEDGDDNQLDYEVSTPTKTPRSNNEYVVPRTPVNSRPSDDVIEIMMRRIEQLESCVKKLSKQLDDLKGVGFQSVPASHPVTGNIQVEEDEESPKPLLRRKRK